jgi:hypothetical protein
MPRLGRTIYESALQYNVRGHSKTSAVFIELAGQKPGGIPESALFSRERGIVAACIT